MSWDNIFKLDVSLQDLSGVVIAISLWERPDVKGKIKSDFGSYSFYNRYDNNSSWLGERTANYIGKQLDSLKFPERLLQNIKMFVTKIGHKIYGWRDYVTHELNINERFAEKIYWTSYGEIDELKILRKVWLKDPTFPNGECNCYLKKNRLYCLVCSYAEESFVRTRLQDMKNQIFTCLPASYKKNSWPPYAVIAVWLCFCTSKTKKKGLEVFKSFRANPDKIAANQLFSICLNYGYLHAAKYFWKRVKVDEKHTLAVEGAERCLNWRGRNNPNHGKAHSIKMLFFFLSKMNEIQKMEFITQNFVTLFKLLMQVWPYQALSENFLNTMWDYMSNHHETFFKLALNYLQWYNNNDFYQRMSMVILEKVPKEVKKKYFLQGNFQNFGSLYFKLNDDTLKFILNDSDLKHCKRDMMDFASRYFDKSVRKGDYKDIDRFINLMEFSQEERKVLKRELNMLSSFLKQGDINLADEHLHWLADTEDERNELKEESISIELFPTLILENKFKAAKEFLRWRYNSEEDRKAVLQTETKSLEIFSLLILKNKFTEAKEFLELRFGSEEDRRNVKVELITEDFLTEKTFELWGSKPPTTSTSVVIDKCSELLNMFLESEEEITKFKKSLLLPTELLIEKFWDHLFYQNSFAIVDSFLRFCLLSSDDIETIKQNIKYDINWWIETFAIKKGDFQMIDALFNWVYDSKKERKSAIKEYVTTPRGCLLCIKVFKKYSERTPIHILNFFNNWIKRSFNFSEMKMHLKGFDESIASQTIISCIVSLLGKRQDGHRVTKSDLKNRIEFETFCSHSASDFECGSCERGRYGYGGYGYEEEEEELEEEESEKGTGDESSDDDY